MVLEAIPALVVGLVCCFFGRKLVKLAVAVAGFLAMASLVEAMDPAAGPWVFGLAGVAGAVVGLLFAFWAVRVGSMLLGASLALVVTRIALEASGTPANPIGLVSAGVIGGGVGLLASQTILALATAGLGSWLTVAATIVLLGEGTAGTPGAGYVGDDGGVSLLWLAWPVLTWIGTRSQTGARKKSRPKDD